MHFIATLGLPFVRAAIKGGASLFSKILVGNQFRKRSNCYETKYPS
jgi:hypothetical protein